MLVVFVSIHLAAWLRMDFDWGGAYAFFAWPVLVVLLVRLITFRWFRTYAVIIRYAGAADVIQVFLSTLAGSLFLLGLSVLGRFYGYNLSISILFIEFFLTLTLLSASRILMPIAYELLFQTKRPKENAIIIGAGQLGAMTRNVIRQDKNADFEIVAILDDNPSVRNKFLDGIPVLPPEQLVELNQEERVDKAIFAIENISNKRKNEIVDLCIAEGVKVLQVPFQSKWREGEFQANQIREIQIEDLLNRPVISLLEDQLYASYQNKVVLITGGAGSIGSEIIRQLVKYQPAEILLLDQAETPTVNMTLECREEHGFDNIRGIVADVQDAGRIREVFDSYRPEIVFHAAAYKHVPIMEQYPREAVGVNVGGTKILADLSNEFGIEKFIMVSTDKAVNPTNVMGATKRIAEIYIQSLNEHSDTQYITTRFGNVLGSNGSVVPRFKKQIAKGGPVTVTHEDITRYFMTIPEASLLVLEAGAMGDGGEIFLFDMGDPVKIVDLAKRMIRLSGFKPNVDIEVEITGLRPGEKLYEELLSTKENSLATHHDKITRARVRKVPYSLAQQQIGALIELIPQSHMDLVAKMKEIVPEFKSNNSVYQSLDKSHPSSIPSQ